MVVMDQEAVLMKEVEDKVIRLEILGNLQVNGMLLVVEVAVLKHMEKQEYLTIQKVKEAE